jgi:hypothetical protein
MSIQSTESTKAQKEKPPGKLDSLQPNSLSLPVILSQTPYAPAPYHKFVCIQHGLMGGISGIFRY